jgi:hypothetical protein
MLDSMMDECINNEMETKDKNKKYRNKKNTTNQQAGALVSSKLIDKYANNVDGLCSTLCGLIYIYLFVAPSPD